VREACRRVLFLDGRGNHTQLRFLVVEELELRRESYVPVVKVVEPDNMRPSLAVSGDRVWPKAVVHLTGAPVRKPDAPKTRRA